MALAPAVRHGIHVIEDSPQGLKEGVGDDTEQVEKGAWVNDLLRK